MSENTDAKNLLEARLRELNFTPDGLAPYAINRLLAVVELEHRKLEQRKQQRLQERVDVLVTPRSIGHAVALGEPIPGATAAQPSTNEGGAQ